MLTDTRNAELYADWLKAISHSQTQAAFQYIVGIAACLPGYQCQIQWKGEVRDFRFHDEGGAQEFSFIVNNCWILFYFRPPAVRSGQYSCKDLKNLFDSFAENSAREWTVKLRSIADVDRLIRLLGW